MRRIFINRLTDKEFYEIIYAYSKGRKLRKLLKAHACVPDKFLKQTLTGDIIKALDFCLATRKHLQFMSENFKKRYRTNRCMPLSYLDTRRPRKTGIPAYNKNNLLSKRELDNIDDFFFGG